MIAFFDTSAMIKHYIKVHSVRTLDAIQLASACIAEPNIFVTSDKKLSQFARQELTKVIFI